MIKPYKLIRYNNVKNIIAKDDKGYKYKITLANLQDNKTPSKWIKNPFNTENALLYLSINYPNYEWIDNIKYNGCKYKHQFICHIHKDKSVKYRILRDCRTYMVTYMLKLSSLSLRRE